VISLIREAAAAKRMKLDRHCQHHNCTRPKCTFQRCIDYIDIAGRSSDRVYNQNREDENGDFQPVGNLAKSR